MKKYLFLFILCFFSNAAYSQTKNKLPNDASQLLPQLKNEIIELKIKMNSSKFDRFLKFPCFMKFIDSLLCSSIDSSIFILKELILIMQIRQNWKRFMASLWYQIISINQVTVYIQIWNGLVHPDFSCFEFFSIPDFKFVYQLFFWCINVFLKTVKFLFETLQFTKVVSILSFHIFHFF